MSEGIPSGVNIKMADACAHLDVTSGAAYQIWSSQADYQNDLTIHIIERFEWTTRSGNDVIMKALTDAKTVDEALYAVAMADFRRLISRPEFYLVLHLWLVAKLESKQGEMIRDGYREFHNGLVGRMKVGLDMLGLTIRPGSSWDELALASAALGQGFALRYRFDPLACGRGEAYAESTLALIRHHTIPKPGNGDSDAGLETRTFDRLADDENAP